MDESGSKKRKKIRFILFSNLGVAEEKTSRTIFFLEQDSKLTRVADNEVPVSNGKSSLRSLEEAVTSSLITFSGASGPRESSIVAISNKRLAISQNLL